MPSFNPPTCSHSHRLEKVGLPKLTRYLAGAAGVAGVLGGTHASAAVVYWNPIDTTATPNSGFRFDMVSGVVAAASNVGDYTSQGFVVWNYSAPDFVTLYRTGSSFNPGVSSGGLNRLADLDFGTTIGYGSGFGNGDQIHFDLANYPGYAWNTNADGTTGYVGLQFRISGNTHYGWARFTYDDATTGNITLHDFAYEDVAEQSILAGAGAVPEPNRTLLALAGLGGVTLRRRRKQAV